MSIRIINNTISDLQWIDVIKPTKEDIPEIKKILPFLLDQDIITAWRDTERSKSTKREKYIYLDLLVPFYNKKTKSIIIDEIDFFIGRHFVMTVHQGTLTPIMDLFSDCNQNQQKKNKYFANSSENLLAYLLQLLLESTFPMFDDVEEELERLKKSIFIGKNSRAIVKDILINRRNITDLRKAMRGYSVIISHLLKHEQHEEPLFYIKHHANFVELIDYSREIWEDLESYKEIIEALEDANESMLSHMLNDVMRILTTFSVVLLPASLVAGIFGMNAKFIPFAGHPIDFWIFIICIFCVSSSILMIILKKFWIK